VIPLFASLIACVAVSAIVSAAISHWKQQWPARWAVFTAALPLPIALGLLCAWMFIDAAMASREECGVDACAMAMVFSMVGIGWSLTLFVIGAVSAAFARRYLGRP